MKWMNIYMHTPGVHKFILTFLSMSRSLCKDLVTLTQFRRIRSSTAELHMLNIQSVTSQFLLANQSIAGPLICQGESVRTAEVVREGSLILLTTVCVLTNKVFLKLLCHPGRL